MIKAETIQSKRNCIVSYIKSTHKQNNDMLIKRSELDELKIYQNDITELMNKGYIEKIRQGWYQVIQSENAKSEAALIAALFPDGVICMHTALFHFGYSDRTPLDWDIAIDRNASKSRFKLDYPYIKPYYMEKKHLAYGITEADFEDCRMHIFDRDRLLCECIRNESSMDKETYNKAIQAYINDSKKCISNLIEYAKRRNILNKVKNRIGVWL
jgi:predicted transcriptional regulator of viral defense system